MTAIHELAAASAPRTLNFEFGGRGGEFFRIWIVNVVLTVLTLGIYSAWAKVRTFRYFYGNTKLDDTSFEYHADPVRILIGRAIAVGLLIAISLVQNFYPEFAFVATPIYIAAFPFFIKMSLRFNARMTSYRNVRFNFVGTYWDAFKSFVLWPLAAALTIGILWPLAHRAGKHYYINNHTYGGRPFEANIPGASMYGIYILGIVFVLVLAAPIAEIISSIFGISIDAWKAHIDSEGLLTLPASLISVVVAGYLAMALVFFFIMTKVTNLAINRTVFDDRHSFSSRLSVFAMMWITLTNAFLTAITLSLFYPWARVRHARYRAKRTKFIVSGDLSEFVSQAFAKQSAAGEEIADIFDFDIGI